MTPLLRDYKEKVKQLAEEQKIGQHVRDHKDLYIGLGTGLAIMMLTISGRHATTNAPTKVIVRSFNLFAKNSGNIVINVLVPDGRGHPGYPVFCLETMTWFPSQRAAAIANNISRTKLSQHMRGLRESVSGLHFVYPEA